MRSRLRQKALRLIFSQLVASDLSPSELREIGYELRFGALGEDLNFLLDASYQQLSRDDSFKNTDPHNEDLLEIVQRKRMSKKALYERMRSIEGFRHAGVSTDMSAREMIMHFVDWASPEQVQALYFSLDGNDREDPYLSGIMNRK